MDILLFIRSAPGIDPEPLELALALAAFDQPPCLIFEGAGLQWLTKDIQAFAPGGKSPAKLLKSLPLYDCDQVYYLDDEVPEGTQLNSIASMVNSQQVSDWIASAKHCLSF